MERSLRYVLAAALAATSLLAACRTDSSVSDSPGDSDRPAKHQNKTPDRGAERTTTAVLDRHIPDSEVSDCTSLDDSEDESRDEIDPSNLQPFRAEGAVATVDGEPISAEQFNRRIAAKFGGSRTTDGMPRRMAESMKQKTLKSVVESILIDRLLDDHPSTVSPAEIREELRAFQKRFPSDQAFQSFLETRALSPRELVSEICRDRRLRALLAKDYDIEIDSERVREHYRQHSTRYEEPAQVRASHVLVEIPPDASEEKASKAEERASELAAKARGDSIEFAELARNHSDGPSADKGGDLGYFARDRMVDDFAEAAFDADPGDIVGPVRTKFGFHVIYVRDRRPADTRNFDDVRENIRDRLEKRAFRNALDDFKSGLRTRYDIERHPERVNITIGGSGKRQPSAPALPDPSREESDQTTENLDEMMKRRERNDSRNDRTD